MSEPYPEPIIVKPGAALWEIQNALNALHPNSRAVVRSMLSVSAEAIVTIHPSPKEETP